MGHTWASMVLEKMAEIPKSSFRMRKWKAQEGRNLPRVLHTIRDTAGKGTQSAYPQCGDLAHLAHLCSRDLLNTYCVPGTVLASGIKRGKYGADVIGQGRGGRDRH